MSMQDEMHIEDGSNDRMYFTMVPNLILNHSSAVDQALYLQMKRFAGEKNGGGYCSASKRTLMDKLKIGIKALNTSLEYLIEHKWIEQIGTRSVMTIGGAQDIQVYRVNDIWKLNTEHYKGVAKSTPLTEGVAESTQGALKSTQGVAESTPTKNVLRTKENTSVAIAPQVYEITEGNTDTERPKKESTAKYPHYKEVFALWGKYPSAWDSQKNVRERDAAENLYHDIGIDEIKVCVEFLSKHISEKFCPKIYCPSDLQDKYKKLEAYSQNI